MIVGAPQFGRHIRRVLADSPGGSSRQTHSAFRDLCRGRIDTSQPEADMAFFGNLFGRKEPATRVGEVWVDAPSFLGAQLLLQFVPEDRPLLTDQELADLTTPFSTEMRTLAELWIVMYVTWLMRLLVSAKFDEDVSDEMMASVYGRIATNQDRLPGIQSIADGIKYWFKELDEGVRDAI